MQNAKKWIGYGVRVVILVSIIVAVYSGVVVLRKYIREETREYDSVQEIIDSNYKDAEMEILGIRNYYYLIEEKKNGNKEELIRFEDNKYFAFDKVLRNTKGIGADSDSSFNSEIFFTDVIVYKYGDEYAIVVKRKADQEFMVIYDNYEIWKSKLVGDTFYYFNVRNLDELTYEYGIFATDNDKTYEIANRTRIKSHVLD